MKDTTIIHRNITRTEKIAKKLMMCSHANGLTNENYKLRRLINVMISY